MRRSGSRLHLKPGRDSADWTHAGLAHASRNFHHSSPPIASEGAHAGSQYPIEILLLKADGDGTDEIMCWTANRRTCV